MTTSDGRSLGQFPDPPVKGGSRHAEIPCHLGDRLSPPSISRRAFRIRESVKVRRCPPRSLPAALRLATEPVIRSRSISRSIWARAAVTVKSIEPIGVAASTSPPPRFSTRIPAPLPRSASVKASMFCVDLPGRSSVVTTKVPPGSRAATACRRRDASHGIPALHGRRRGHRAARPRPAGRTLAGRRPAAASTPGRT